MMPNPFYVDGKQIHWTPAAPAFAGAALIEALGRGGEQLPGPDEPPYLFCANGSCRDCNLLVDGIADVPSCRLFLAPGMSFRSGEGAGEENALSRRLGQVADGEPLAADVAVVGAGPSGRAAAEAARRLGVETVLLEARAEAIQGGMTPRPVGAVGGMPFVMEGKRRRRLRARTIVLANGARDAEPRLPGSTLAGVLPLSLLDRYLALGTLPGESILVAGGDEGCEAALRDLGAKSCTFLPDARALAEVSGRNRVERARWRGPDGGPEVEVEVAIDVDVDVVFVGPGREPSLELARALGCRTFYDRAAGYDRLVTGENGTTSAPGILACGDVALLGTKPGARDAREAEEMGRLAGRAAASLSRTRRSEW